jgi:hypothetical protein
MSHLCAQGLVPRPTVAEVHAALVAWRGLIVHFSGVPKLLSSGFSGVFPDDLRNVRDGNAQGGISCSTVRAGDVFENTEGNRNSNGCVGLIVRSRSPWSLVGVAVGDAGSSVDPITMERTCWHANLPLQIDEVQWDLDGRMPDGCNEWVMRDYDVLGLLAQLPLHVHQYGTKATPDELRYAADGLPIYTFRGGVLNEVDSQLALTRAVPICELYPP